MPDFPQSRRINRIMIGTHSAESLGTAILTMSASGGLAAWPTADLAIYVPIQIYHPVTIANMTLTNGATVSGNVDVGIYEANGAKIVSAGSTAQAGTSAVQVFNITDTLLSPGLYYAAVALDNNTGTLFRWAPGSSLETRAVGLYQEAAAFPLPATATFAALVSAFIPLIGLTEKAVI